MTDELRATVAAQIFGGLIARGDEINERTATIAVEAADLLNEALIKRATAEYLAAGSPLDFKSHTP